MENSNLTISVEAKGVAEARAQIEAMGATLTKLAIKQNGSVKATGKFIDATDELTDKTNKNANAVDRASRSQANYFAHIAKTTVQSALINKLFLEFVDVAGQAIQSVDLMNNFPATMASMGQSTDDAKESMKALNTYVGQVGGNIGQATSMVTRFTGVTKDVKAATAVYTGLNNALIAGDSSAEEQKQALLQFAQAFERGKPDMREWNSLTQNMSFQLAQVAKRMGYLNANALGQALRDGEESMGAFVTTLTEMSTGTGVIAKQAMTRMQGMQFAFNVLKNTMVQGLATIIQTLGRNNIVSYFTFSTQVVIAFTQSIVWLINVIISLASAISQLLGGPALGQMKGDADGIAEGLSAGAAGADDMSGALKDSNKDAKELKKTLASFDKMNVLEEPKGNKDDDETGKGTTFDQSMLDKLGKAFDDIGGKLQDVGIWAKIVAGIIATIAGIKFAQGIIDQVGGINKSFANAGKGVQDFKDKLKEMPSRALEKVQEFPTVIAGKMTGAKAGFASFGRFLLNPLVLLAAAIAVVVGSLVWLYNTNEDFKKGIDSVWNPFIDVVKEAGKTIRNVFGGTISWMKKQWEDLKPSLQPVIDIFGEFTGWLDSIAIKFGITGSMVEKFGKVIGVVGATLALLVLAPVVALVATLALVGLAFVAVVGAVTWFVKTAGRFLTEFIWGIKLGFEYLWQSIKDVWYGAGEWFINLFALTIIGIQDAWRGVGDWFINLFALAIIGIQDAWRGLVQWFRNLWNNIVNVFIGAPAWFASVFSNAYNAVTNAFSNLWFWFKANVWDRIVNVFSGIGTSVGDAIGNAFRGVMNTVLRALSGIYNTFQSVFNGAADTINKISPVKVKSLARWDVPQLARGGVVDRPTIAQIGENGEEAVVPLENNTEWIDKLAAKINTSPSTATGNDMRIPSKLDEQQATNNITIEVSGVFATSVAEQRRIADLIAKRINESVGNKSQVFRKVQTV